MPEVGDILDGYRLDAVVGRGGMGTVYRATDLALEKTVAVKVIAPHLANDETFVGRFREEAKALARLNARGVVGIHAMRETDDAMFLVMEHVEGPSLKTILERRGALEFSEATSVIRQILEAVQHAHGAGVLHRDLKPSNILIAADGRVKITDFGLAKIVTSDAKLTSTHERMGTAAYMSPEQIRGLKNVSAASDLFSVGLMAYEMLVGRLPYDATASDFSVQRSIVEEVFPPPSTYEPSVPPDLERLVMDLLAKNPAERPSSATKALGRLSESDVPDDETRPIALEPAERRSSSLLQWSALAVVAIVLLTGAFLGVRAALHIPAAPAPDTLATATLSVSTTPEETTVWIDGDSLGRTPLHWAVVPAGSLRVRLTRTGYVPLDTTLLVRSSERLSASLAARSEPSESMTTSTGVDRDAVRQASSESAPAASPGPSSATGILVLRSQPSSATVEVNGRARGQTPITLDDVPAGAHRVALRLGDHRPFETTVEVAATDTTEIAPRLAPHPAIIRLRAIPSGDILVNGTARARDASTTMVDSLPPGSHDLVLISDLGRWEETVQLGPGDRYERTVDFSKTVEVSVTAQRPDGTYIPNAAVQVDDSTVGYTPQQLTLRAGQHTFRISKEGYAPHTRTVMLESEREDPLIFVLTESPGES